MCEGEGEGEGEITAYHIWVDTSATSKSQKHHSKWCFYGEWQSNTPLLSEGTDDHYGPVVRQIKMVLYGKPTLCNSLE